MAIPRTIPIDSTRDAQTMHTIQIGTRTYAVSNPNAAMLMREARRLESEGREGLARGLANLAMKIDNGTLPATQTVAVDVPIREAA